MKRLMAASILFVGCGGAAEDIDTGVYDIGGAPTLACDGEPIAPLRELEKNELILLVQDRADDVCAGRR